MTCMYLLIREKPSSPLSMSPASSQKRPKTEKQPEVMSSSCKNKSSRNTKRSSRYAVRRCSCGVGELPIAVVSEKTSPEFLFAIFASKRHRASKVWRNPFSAPLDPPSNHPLVPKGASPPVPRRNPYANDVQILIRSGSMPYLIRVQAQRAPRSHASHLSQTSNLSLFLHTLIAVKR